MYIYIYIYKLDGYCLYFGSDREEFKVEFLHKLRNSRKQNYKVGLEHDKHKI